MPPRTRRPPPVSPGLQGAASLEGAATPKVTRGQVRSFRNCVPGKVISNDYKKSVNMREVSYLLACEKTNSPEKLKIPKGLRVVISHKTGKRGIVRSQGIGHGFFSVIVLENKEYIPNYESDDDSTLPDEYQEESLRAIIVTVRGNNLTWL